MDIKQKNKDLNLLFEPDLFREQGHQIVDILADYLQNLKENKTQTVLPNIDPKQMMDIWPGEFSAKGDGQWEEDLNKVINLSNHLHNPKYIGHQVSAPLPFSSLIEMVGTLLNNGSAVYEMGPSNVIMEQKIILWMSKLIGYDKKADGIFTSGGTIGNLTALLAARQKMFNTNVWKNGVFNQDNNYIMVSSQSHYSINRAASVMGLGERSIIKIPVDNEFRMDISEIEKIYTRLKKQGKNVFAIIANACSTSTGTYDDLNEIANFCKKNNIWMHVDGAHGASILLSDKYKTIMKGVERADSIVWDAHKMLLMPSLITAVIFKDGDNSYKAFSQEASYLFNKKPSEEWYNYAHRTMECTKKMMGLKLYLSLKNFGTDIFKTHIEYTHSLTKNFANIINNKDDFELAVKPQSNIICFRYLSKESNNRDLNNLQVKIKKRVLKSEKYYIVQTDLNGLTWLRCTIINPLTKIEDLNQLLTYIIEVASSIKHD